MSEVIVSRHMKVNLDTMNPHQQIIENVDLKGAEILVKDISNSGFKLDRSKEKDPPISNGVVSFLIDFLYYESYQLLFPMSSKCSKLESKSGSKSISLSREELSHPFACNICEFVLNEPVSLPCGHSYCRSCVMKWRLNFCRVCKRYFSLDSTDLKCNILVSRFVQEWWHDELEATASREDCKNLVANGKYEQAVESYSNSLSKVCHDHITLCNRSYVCMKVNEVENALSDADEAIFYQPFWAKAYFRRAVALRALRRRQDAVVAFLVCAVLEENLSGVRDHLQQLLVELMLTSSAGQPGSAPSSDHSPSTQPSPATFSDNTPSKHFFSDKSPGNERLLAPYSDPADISSSDKPADLPSSLPPYDKSTVLSSSAPPFDKPADLPSSSPPYDKSTVLPSSAPPCDKPADLPSSSPPYDKSTVLPSSAPPCDKPAHFPSSSPPYDKSTVLPSSAPPCDKSAIVQPPSVSQCEKSDVISDESSGHDTISVGLKTLSLYLREHYGGSGTRAAYELCLRELFSQCIAHVQALKGRLGKQYRRRVAESVSVCVDDFECSLCCRLLWQPTTTSCGHTFCRPCLNRWLDHRATCPLCQNPLNSLLAERERFTTRFLQHAIETLLPEALAERRRAHWAENLMGAQSVSEASGEHGDQLETPVFVCTLALPSLACPLHVFEPRYRLMVRRCMESGRRQFGMCMPSSDPDSDGFVDVGVMLEVRDVRFLSDGRSVVHCVGGRRFRCLSKGQCDGYSTARVQLLSDEQHSDQLPRLQQLHRQVRLMVESWWTQLRAARSAQLFSRVLAYYGPLPGVEADYWLLPDGPAWLWWTLAILPLSHSVQLDVMAMPSLERRLRAVKNVLLRLKSASDGSELAGTR